MTKKSKKATGEALDQIEGALMKILYAPELRDEMTERGRDFVGDTVRGALTKFQDFRDEKGI